MKNKFEYKIIRSKRRKKTTSLIINNNREVIIRAPRHVSELEIKKFVNKNTSWISKKLKEYKPRLKPKYENGEKFWYLGKKYPLQLLPLTSQRESLSLNNNIFVFKGNSYSKSKVKNFFENFYRKETKSIISPLVNEITSKINKDYNRIVIKKVKTRWGSCSNKKNLNFNLKLSMVPKKVINYVVVHEVCHLVHLNHSKNFWNLVKSLDPHYKIHKDWLNKHENVLIY